MNPTSDTPFLVRDSLYIDGRWIPSRTDGRLEVVDSNTGRAMGTAPKGAARPTSTRRSPLRTALSMAGPPRRWPSAQRGWRRSATR